MGSTVSGSARRESFSDLSLSEFGSDTVITFSDLTITLAGISQTQITSSDFLFV
jgi:hypothetical protein